MPKYIVTEHGWGTRMYRVDADDEQSAKDIVADGAEEIWFDDFDVERVEVVLRDEG
ncbi:hypothetical protein FDI69_gp221 [Rhodococcus phage Trina]|uniref:Uncharacterized protein n=1 Tax=Rhodococcus phage Trina TaxID=2027905 RepID=A0A2D0ZMA0_9CAUD|nr:hypothetical protein FDI69_gp221 [Rhodococcus phage Trina]ASZ74965.1 hypothetical protein SEA_TRINA_181 [Rhodococcus phage Trina]